MGVSNCFDEVTFLLTLRFLLCKKEYICELIKEVKELSHLKYVVKRWKQNYHNWKQNKI